MMICLIANGVLLKNGDSLLKDDDLNSFNLIEKRPAASSVSLSWSTPRARYSINTNSLCYVFANEYADRKCAFPLGNADRKLPSIMSIITKVPRVQPLLRHG